MSGYIIIGFLQNYKGTVQNTYHVDKDPQLTQNVK